MSKLSKRNRYQKSKPAPTKALPALAVAIPKVAAAVGKFAASNPEATKKAGGFIKNLLNKKNKNSNNQQEVAEEKNYYADKSGGDFSHLSQNAPFAMNSPFKKKPGSDDAVSVTSSVKGVSNQQTGNYDVEARDINITAGSSSDPLVGKPNTAAGAESATQEIDFSKVTTSGVDDATDPNKTVIKPDGTTTTNPNSSKAAIEQSKGKSNVGPGGIGTDSYYGSLHNKPYWVNKGVDKAGNIKWRKKNDGMIVKPRPDEVDGKITHTNPFAKPDAKPADSKPTTKPAPVAPDSNKKTNQPTSINKTSGYLKYDNARYQEGFNKDKKWFPGLNNAVEDRAEAREQGDKVREAHLQAIIDKLRAESELNKTQNNAKENKSEYVGEFDKDGNQVSSRKGDAGNKTNVHKVSGNTNMVLASSVKPAGVKAKSGSGIVSGSGVSSTKASNVKSNELMATKGANIAHTKRVAKEAGLGDITATKDAINVKDSATKSKAQNINEAPSSKPSKSTKKKVEKPIIKENKKKEKLAKKSKTKTGRSKNSKLKFKKAGGKRGSGIVKANKNPLFKS
jgi:hypothetical protein